MRFRTRIALLFIALIVIVQGVTVVTVLLSVAHNVTADAKSKLDSGERVLNAFVDRRGDNLERTVAALSSGNQIGKAMATGNKAVIKPVLDHNSARAKADIAAVFTSDGALVAHAGTSTLPDLFHFQALLKQASERGTTSAIVALDGKPIRLVATSVDNTPTPAWVVMGFYIDAAAAKSMQRLTGLGVSFIVRDSRGRVVNAVSTLPATARGALQSGTGVRQRSPEPPYVINLGGENWLTQAVELSGDHQVQALLQMSSEAEMAPFRRVRRRLIAQSAGTVVLFVIGTLLLAGGVTRPVRDLLKASRRVRHGDYSVKVAQHAGELGRLGAAFNQMQTAIHEREQRIEHQAYHDRLTDLPNRNLIVHKIDSVTQNNGHGAILVMDINRFNDINDTLGHEVGDGALMAIARRLTRSVQGNDVVARLGSDDFLVLLKGANRTHASWVAGELAKRISEPTVIGDITLYLDASVGVVLYPEHGHDAETLLRRADMAVSDAKSTRAGAMIYRHGRDERRLEQLALMSDFRSAVENDELQVYYQPKMRMTDGTVTHAEALVRWHHPTRGLVEPMAFVPLAEQSGNIRWLTEWMLRSVVKQLSEWHEAGRDLTVAVNLSAYDLADATLAERIRVLLEQHAVPAKQLILEITESAALRDLDASVVLLNKLRRLGIRVAIDDFGTGYSSLSQLKRLPVDELKIDKSFVLALHEASEDAVIVRSAIELGHNMGLEVIAEGVETQEAQSTLKAYQCDMAQGFLISKPLPSEAFMSWLEAHRNRRGKGSGSGVV